MFWKKKEINKNHVCYAEFMLMTRDPGPKDLKYYCGQMWENILTKNRFFFHVNEKGAQWILMGNDLTKI
jgi:hypothetical protein